MGSVGKGVSVSLLVVVVCAAVVLAIVMPVSPGNLAYTFSSPSAGVVDVSASSLTSDNDRVFFSLTDGTTTAAASACETASGISPTQPGLAFRITNHHHVFTAVTVTENIFESPSEPAYNDFNVHMWDTSRSPAFSLVAQVKIQGISPSPQPEPLNLCAEITNNVVQFVAWTSGPRPPWGDPTQGASVTLPGNAPASGRTGFFAGHSPPGTSAVYSNLTVDGAATNPLRCCTAIQFASSPIAS